ncbi:uncharacterized protein LTR77_010298 [Saxophila tyrrhenica]|uniref:Heterokaryon incompatibility domain-containing protein n=1 Tax=Saxophila tyrrhenica TaxID=1690608 RepID=A0AAV9NW78_9PEZI|nr:hypothetical protein LTR77_010298 [Saxophila tyrrhenica]
MSFYDRPLANNEIRLLLLRPSPDPTAPIECDPETRSLNGDGPAYEALSYTWGPPYPSHDDADIVFSCYNEQPRAITLRGQEVGVKSNLYDCLLRFRSKETTRVLWVDALCINQQDLEERAQQVSIMSEVYKQCTSALIWLGEEMLELDVSIIMPLFSSIVDPMSGFNEFDKWLSAASSQTSLTGVNTL